MNNPIKLYNYFRSSTSYRVRIALNLKKLKYEYIPVHLLNNGGEQNKESYRQINPMGGVPTLVFNDETVAQSTAILEYLDEAFPETTPLLPQDKLTRAHIRQFCQNINADTHPYANLKTTKELEKKFNATEAQKTEWIQYWCEQGLTACEKMLNKNHNSTYCYGEKITMADILLIPMLFSAQRFQVDIKKFQILNKINENCLKLEEFIQAHPFRQIDTPEELKIK